MMINIHTLNYVRTSTYIIFVTDMYLFTILLVPVMMYFKNVQVFFNLQYVLVRYDCMWQDAMYH